MKLIDLESDKDYILDGKYAVKAGKDKAVGKLCYKIYVKYKMQRRYSMRQYDYFVDTAGLLNHWKIFDPSVLYIRERPFTKSDRTHLGKTVFWTREEAEQAIESEVEE
jgi:hypothetical protein